MNTRRSTGSINSNNSSNNNNKRGLNRLYVAALTTKTITPELHAINAKICRLVEQHPCMYDRSHPYYMRKSHVERAWEDISKEMNDSLDNCKERFRNIRTSFARSINVQRGSNRIKPYYLSDELEFLKKHITPGVPVPVKGRRSRDSNRKGDDNDEYDDNEEEEHIGALVHIKHSLSSDEHEHENSTDSSEWVAEGHAQSGDTSQMPEQPPSQLPSQSDDDELKPKIVLPEGDDAVQPACPIPPKKRRRIGVEVANIGESAVNSADTDVTSATLDFDDAFLQGLRPEMKQMNFHQKLHFKRRVYDLLGEIFECGDTLSCQPARTNGQAGATPSPTTLQQLGLMARSGTLQLPRLAPKPAKDL